MALLDDEELLPFFGNPNIQRQGARARALAAQRDVNTLPDPRTYAAVSGLLGTAPDQMGFSVLNPQYESIMQTARPAFYTGTALGVAPIAGLAGKVGAKVLGPTAAKMTEGYLQRQGLMPGVLPVENKNMLSYRGSHTAPGPDFGAPLHDLTGGGQMYPADVYSAKAAQYYGTGYPKADKEAFALAQRVRGNPNAEITMYRAVPKDENITNINAGDWVSLSKDYAKTHGESVLQGDYKILSQKVKAKDLWTNADSIHEFGYQPQKLPAPQQAALDLAQQRAALPVEQGGLGLLGSNTAEQRAKAMGFTQDAYHGTPIFPGGLGDILKFNPNASVEMARRKPSLDTVGSWFSNNPASAGMYEGGGYGAIYPVKINPGNVKETTFENMNRTAMRLAGENPKTGEYAKPNAVQAYKDWLDANKINSLSISHNPESPSTEFLNQVATVVRNPDDIRSRFAAFDPFRRSAAVAATMGAAAPDLLAAQQDEEMRKLQQLGLLGMVAP